jgi:hypothetical protein
METMTTFDDFWLAYPKRRGSNPKHPASLKFATAVKNGADPAHIISSARRFRDEAAEQGNIDTPFIPMASTWLNQKRWLDYAPDNTEKIAKSEDFMATKGYVWNGERWEKTDATTH